MRRFDPAYAAIKARARRGRRGRGPARALRPPQRRRRRAELHVGDADHELGRRTRSTSRAGCSARRSSARRCARRALDQPGARRPARPAARAAGDRERRAGRRRGVRQRRLRLRHPLRARGRDRARCALDEQVAPDFRARFADRLPARAARCWVRAAPAARPGRARGTATRPTRSPTRASSRSPRGRARRSALERAPGALRLSPSRLRIVTSLLQSPPVRCIPFQTTRTSPGVVSHSPGRIRHGSNRRCHYSRAARGHHDDRSTSTAGPTARTCARTRAAPRPGL